MIIVASPFRYAEGIEHLCPYSELKFRDKVRHVFSLPVCTSAESDKQVVSEGRLLRATPYGGLLTKEAIAGATAYEYIEVIEVGGHLKVLTTFSQVVKFVLAKRTYGVGGDDYTCWSTPDGTNIKDIPFDRYVFLEFYGTKIYTAAANPADRYKIQLYGFF